MYKKFFFNLLPILFSAAALIACGEQYTSTESEGDVTEDADDILKGYYIRGGYPLVVHEFTPIEKPANETDGAYYSWEIKDRNLNPLPETGSYVVRLKKEKSSPGLRCLEVINTQSPIELRADDEYICIERDNDSGGKWFYYAIYTTDSTKDDTTGRYAKYSDQILDEKYGGYFVFAPELENNKITDEQLKSVYVATYNSMRQYIDSLYSSGDSIVLNNLAAMFTSAMLEEGVERKFPSAVNGKPYNQALQDKTNGFVKEEGSYLQKQFIKINNIVVEELDDVAKFSNLSLAEMEIELAKVQELTQKYFLLYSQTRVLKFFAQINVNLWAALNEADNDDYKVSLKHCIKDIKKDGNNSKKYKLATEALHFFAEKLKGVSQDNYDAFLADPRENTEVVTKATNKYSDGCTS